MMSKNKSMIAGRRAAWGHASDLLSNYVTNKIVRPELERYDPPRPTAQMNMSPSAPMKPSVRVIDPYR
jgi:hypothetical protein